MAYVNQAIKTKIAPKIKAICAKYKVKGSLSIRHHSTLVLTIKSGAIDFIGNGNVTCGQANTSGYEQINPYHYGSHYSGKAKKFLQEVLAEMNAGNHDNSNSQIDYFDVGWYVDVNIGKWNQQYAISV